MEAQPDSSIEELHKAVDAWKITESRLNKLSSQLYLAENKTKLFREYFGNGYRDCRKRVYMFVHAIQF